MDFSDLTEKQINTLCEELQIEQDDLKDYMEKGDYLVLTDAEADEQTADYIKDTLWAFNADFLASETGIDRAVFEAIQNNGKCENNNRAIESCIDDMDGFIAAAIAADGRGHFLSSYDGEEIEAGDLFAYRVN